MNISTQPDTVYYSDPVRPFLNTGFDYRGHQVRYEKYDHKYEGCIVTVNHIDGICYPFAHRTEGAAERTAKAIIDSKEAK